MTHPELAEHAVGWDPSTVTRGSDKKKLWKCDVGHEWEAIISSRVSGKGCPVCSGREVLIGFNDLASTSKELAKEAFGWDPTTVTRSSGKRREWKCNLGHVWTATVNNRTAGYGCPVCSGRKVLAGFNDLATTNKELALQAFGWDPTTVNHGSDVEEFWKDEFGHVWEAAVSSRSAGVGCPYCANQKVLSGFNDLVTLDPLLANEAVGWDPSTVTRYSHSKRSWKCGVGHHWDATVADRSSGYGCPFCSGAKTLAGFNDLKTTDTELASEAFGWDPSTLSRGSNLKRKWQCTFGHIWTSSVVNRAYGSGCPSCMKTGFDPNKDGWLYLVIHSRWEMLQVGITNYPTKRLKSHQNLGWEVVELRGPIDGHLTQQWETAILQMLRVGGAGLSNSTVAGRFDGYSEAWLTASFPTNSLKELMDLVQQFEGD